MTRQKLTLPSGATCVVRKLSAADFALHTGDVPVFNPGAPSPAENQKSSNSMEEKVQQMRIAILCCCSPLTTTEGKRLRIVEKELDQLRDGEITIGEIADEDAVAIYLAVSELSGLLRKEAAPSAAKPFPAEQKIPEDLGRLGDTLPLPSEPVACAAG